MGEEHSLYFPHGFVYSFFKQIREHKVKIKENSKVIIVFTDT